mmetsp:Transcript_4471/g.5939  ORF Transcript_4471/g.5939 Transcript_4471/m.5939 type:complete len:238 (+) Transcript_4471:87-800(+)|eukprot:CAMPEP_0185274876 /NCGR_PEP_ID=MMETSP1359-20130426/52810_1 /TAXON_ID=552665 /ORGANISM="Bigelowiella longifila, Strain CCMP242" /LENGTH=237 /DNA_ID=CAMNT_0027868013 /DNA_START=65 /DNA_END=778 /DNA_ORIENTATION=-
MGCGSSVDDEVIQVRAVDAKKSAMIEKELITHGWTMKEINKIVQDTFKALDADGNKMIDANELNQFFIKDSGGIAYVTMEQSIQKSLKAIDSVDTDGNDAFDREEFSYWMKRRILKSYTSIGKAFGNIQKMKTRNYPQALEERFLSQGWPKTRRDAMYKQAYKKAGGRKDSLPKSKLMVYLNEVFLESGLRYPSLYAEKNFKKIIMEKVDDDIGLLQAMSIGDFIIIQNVRKKVNQE